MRNNAIRKVPIEVSARHVHLSPDELSALFGNGYQLTFSKALSQIGQFGAKETVTVIGAKGQIDNVRIVGPLRVKTQVEMSKTDYRAIGVAAPVRISGDLEKSAAISLVGPSGRVDIKEGAIVAKRHLHLESNIAKRWGLKNTDTISIEIKGHRSLIFNEVIIRAGSPSDKLSFQVDTDEANSADIAGGEKGELL